MPRQWSYAVNPIQRPACQATTAAPSAPAVTPISSAGPRSRRRTNHVTTATTTPNTNPRRVNQPSAATYSSGDGSLTTIPLAPASITGTVGATKCQATPRTTPAAATTSAVSTATPSVCFQDRRRGRSGSHGPYAYGNAPGSGGGYGGVSSWLVLTLRYCQVRRSAVGEGIGAQATADGPRMVFRSARSAVV